MKDKFLDFFDNNPFFSKCLQFLHIRDAREKLSNFRTIYINNHKPADYNDPEEPLKYHSNQIKTSKYTFWNFIPKNLFEQFRRIANFYFLINLIVIFIIPDPPTSPYSSMIPILFVVIVTAVKQAYEDILRHISDREVNNLPVRILKEGHFIDRTWKDIKVGDIVEVTADKQFPCDLVLLFSDTDNGACYITTANLDGETNLKRRTVPGKLPVLNSESELEKLHGVIKSDKPNANLYEFNGKILYKNQQIPIANDNILLRGCTLRMTPVIYGCAIYTGKDTKMMRNSKFKSNKLSCIERKLNRFIIVFLLLLAIITFSCFGASFIFTDIYKQYWYLAGRQPKYYDDNRSLYNFIILIFYMNLFNYIVPLSMYVTIELQRFVGSQFIEWDLEIYDEKTNQQAKANTSDLNEDLGQVEYLFSDKTGTLTENEMEFRQLSINGIIYEERDGNIYQLRSNKQIEIIKNDTFFKFFQVLVLCHTVQVDNSSKEGYHASSPDEFSFIKYCIKLGIVFEGEEKDPSSTAMIRRVKFKNKTLNYKVLQVFEFDSDRKRMSVILNDMQTNEIILFTKGAESSVFKCCSKGDIQSCKDDINQFAILGWRTLALAYRKLSQSEYDAIENKINDAYNDITNRNQRMATAFDEIESGLELLGATAVEDKLQEDVANTLEMLRRAGIKVWVLTGDKRETAINISNSCKHFSKEMIKFPITDISDPREIKRKIDQYDKDISEKDNESYALIIDGQTLGHLFNSNLDEDFRNVCMKCDAVLCCRMSPAQKAEVVKLVKKSKNKPLTAAIGDGANDVSMIQEAHVGLGIFGKEGRNAARSADFAFAKFRFAKRILLVHGFLYYTRASNLVQYFFYKNFAFSICQFYYAFFNAFSVSSLYDSIVLTFYNVVFTAFPILLFGLFEQKMSKEKLEKNPYIYRTIKKNRILRAVQFLKWNLLALWHSIVSFFFAFGLFQSSTPFSSDGKLSGSSQFGSFVLTSTVIIVHAKLLIEWQYKSLVLVVGFLLSFLAYVIFCLILNSAIMPYPITVLTDDQSLYWVYYNMFSHGPIWFCLILEVLAAIIPDLIIKVIENLRDTELIRKEKLNEASRINRARGKERVNDGFEDENGQKQMNNDSVEKFDYNNEDKMQNINEPQPEKFFIQSPRPNVDEGGFNRKRGIVNRNYSVEEIK